MEQSQLMQDFHRSFHYIHHLVNMPDGEEKIKKVLQDFSQEDQQKLSEMIQKFTEKMKALSGDLDQNIKDCNAHFANACPQNDGETQAKKQTPDVGDPEHKGPGYKDHNPEG